MSSLFGEPLANALVQALKAAAIERVFGLPGIQNLELFDAFARNDIPTFTPCSESAVIFMADTHARVTGKTSIACVTAGPGLTHALSGLAEALLDSSPLVLLVGANRSHTDKHFQLHEIDQESVVRPLTKAYLVPSSPKEALTMLKQALDLAASGEPGPVALELSSSLLLERGSFGRTEGRVVESQLQSHEASLQAAAQLLIHSDSVGIYAGAGAFGAASQLLELAERLQAPVATTMCGRGVLPEDHPLSVGFGFGRSGTAAALKAFKSVKTLLSIGCKFGETATGSYGLRPPKDHIHIDINPASIGANYPVSIALPLDARVALEALLSLLGAHRKPQNSAQLKLIQSCKSLASEAPFKAPLLPEAVNPARFLRALRLHAPRKATLVTDCGLHQFWALSDFPVYEPRSFILPADFQSMGFGIPGALGAKLAQPERRVLALIGDGGFMMSGFEALNATRWGLPVIIIVFRDNAWGLIREAQKRLYQETPYTSLPQADYAHLAAGFGLEHFEIARDADIEPGLARALACTKACLVEVRVDYSKAPRYVKGAGVQLFKQLPLRHKAGVAWRFLQGSLRKFTQANADIESP